MLRDVDFYYATGLTPRQAAVEPLKFIETLLLVAIERSEVQKGQLEKFKREIDSANR